MATTTILVNKLQKIHTRRFQVPEWFCEGQTDFVLAIDAIGSRVQNLRSESELYVGHYKGLWSYFNH